MVGSVAKIGVIGGGRIGTTIGDAWQRAGHAVLYASRSPEPPRTVSIADAIAGRRRRAAGDCPAPPSRRCSPSTAPALDGRVVIDATNDVGAERLHHADAYPESAPGARLVRAFNTLGFELFAEPAIGGEVADLFWCGPDDAGVEQLIADVGLRPVRVGDIDAIDVVDGVARLWLTLVFRQGHPRRLAFRTLTD